MRAVTQFEDIDDVPVCFVEGLKDRAGLTLCFHFFHMLAPKPAFSTPTLPFILVLHSLKGVYIAGGGGLRCVW